MGAAHRFYIEWMVDQDRTDDLEELVDLIAGMEDIKSVLDDLTGYAAATMTSTTGQPIECAVTLHRRKRTATIGGSSGRAVVLDRIEQSLGDGPCIEALETGVPVLLDDVSADLQWPEYRTALSAAGVASTLGIPMKLHDDGGAVLDFFAPVSGVFNEQAIADGLRFGEMAGKALRLAVRIASVEQRAENLRAAMDTRTVIDLACGIIMAQNKCDKDEAFELLRSASNTRNQKLNELAEGLVSRFARPEDAKAHFDD